MINRGVTIKLLFYNTSNVDIILTQSLRTSRNHYMYIIPIVVLREE